MNTDEFHYFFNIYDVCNFNYSYAYITSNNGYLQTCLSFCECFTAEVDEFGDQLDLVSGNTTYNVCYIYITGKCFPIPVVEFVDHFKFCQAGSEINPDNFLNSSPTVCFCDKICYNVKM